LISDRRVIRGNQLGKVRYVIGHFISNVREIAREILPKVIPFPIGEDLTGSKYNPDSEESKYLIEEEKELQCEIQRFISEF
jgi:hypothetical protein